MKSKTRKQRVAAKKGGKRTAKPLHKPPFTDLNILDLLAFSLGKEDLEIIEPWHQFENGMVTRGVITSDRARRLYSAYAMVHDVYSKLKRDHFELHKKRAHKKRDCAKYQYQCAMRESQRGVLFPLFSAAVAAEHPHAGLNHEACVCRGWKIASDGTDWKTSERHDEQEMAAMMFERMESILNFGITMSLGPDLPEVPEGYEEVATVEDKRIKALAGLLSWIVEEGREGIPLQARLSDEALAVWESSQRVTTVMAIKRRVKYSEFLATILSRIIHLALKDLYPVLVGKEFVLSKGWKVMMGSDVEDTHMRDVIVVML